MQGLGRDRPELAWPLTISMLALAGLPATAGFMGKLYLIEAAVDADYTWLGVAIAIGTMISLAYYLRVVAAVWMRPARGAAGARAAAGMPAMAGGSPEADPRRPGRRVRRRTAPGHPLPRDPGPAGGARRRRRSSSASSRRRSWTGRRTPARRWRPDPLKAHDAPGARAR